MGKESKTSAWGRWGQPPVESTGREQNSLPHWGPLCTSDLSCTGAHSSPDNFQRLVILLMVDTNHKHGCIS